MTLIVIIDQKFLNVFLRPKNHLQEAQGQPVEKQETAEGQEPTKVRCCNVLHIPSL